MTRMFVSACVTASLGLAILAGATAASAAPRGSYLSTCSNVSQSGTMLSARCEVSPGIYASRTQLDLSRCSGNDISNIRGKLRCSGSIPGGSYASSCGDNRVLDGILSSTCADRYGKRFRTRIAIASCRRGDIANIDGQLTCVR